MNDKCIEARREIGRLAKAMLARSLSFIEGSREINRLRFDADLEWDPDIIPFVGIDSETDALPFGEVRKLWNQNALADLKPEIDKAEQWAQSFGAAHCENLERR